MDRNASSKRVLASGPDIQRFLEDAARCTAEYARKTRINYVIPPPQNDTDKNRTVESRAANTSAACGSTVLARINACGCSALGWSNWAGARDPTSRVVQAQGWKTGSFILGSAIGERLGSTAISYNLIVYLTLEMNLSLVKAICTSSAAFAASSLAPLLGVFLADASVGRITTLTAGSIFYSGGLLLFTLLTTAANLRPQTCDKNHGHCQQATSFQWAILLVSLMLQTMGSGAIRPCAAPCAADQFDKSNPERQMQIQNFFECYKACVASAMIVGITVIVYIQTNINWGRGCIVLSSIAGLALISLLLGNPFYCSVEATNSPLRSLVQVLVAAICKRKLNLPGNPDLLYQVKTLDADDVLLLHTENLRWLDKAAILEDWRDIIDPEDCNRWRLCTLQQVEELKRMLRMAPVWICASASAIVFIQTFTIMTKQALTMDLIVGKNFAFPAASMGVFSIVTFVLFVPFYDSCLVPVLRKLTGQPKGFTSLQRIGAGISFGILAMAVSAVVEHRRRQVAVRSHFLDEAVYQQPISGFLLVPQFVLAGLEESFVVPGLLEFFHDGAPHKLQSTTKSFGLAALGVGGVLNVVFVSIIQLVTKTWSSAAHGWLDDNINRGQLVYFYTSLAILESLILIAYAFVASLYVYASKMEHDLGHIKLEDAGADAREFDSVL